MVVVEIMTSRKLQIILLLDAFLLVCSVVGLGFGCGYELQWLIISGILGIAVTVLIGVVVLDCMRREAPLRRDPVEEITKVTIIV